MILYLFDLDNNFYIVFSKIKMIISHWHKYCLRNSIKKRWLAIIICNRFNMFIIKTRVWVNLNLINHDTLILADSLLMFFFTIHLYHTIQLLKNPNYGRAGFSGFFLGLAVMTKPVVIYWVPVIAIIISIILLILNNNNNNWNN